MRPGRGRRRTPSARRQATPCHLPSPQLHGDLSGWHHGPHQCPQCRTLSARQEEDRRRLEYLLVAECWPRVSRSLPPVCRAPLQNKQSLLVCSIFCFFPRENHSTAEACGMQEGSVQTECPWCNPGVPQPFQREGALKAWATSCTRSRWAPGVQGGRTQSQIRPSRWPKSSLCPRTPRCPCFGWGPT